MTTIYVGNLPFSATEEEVRQLFEKHGKVESVKLINDRETGRPRGFGFVEMASSDAQNAIQQTNGFNMGGRPLRVNEAQERTGGGGGGGGNRGGGGGGGGPRTIGCGCIRRICFDGRSSRLKKLSIGQRNCALPPSTFLRITRTS